MFLASSYINFDTRKNFIMKLFVLFSDSEYSASCSFCWYFHLNVKKCVPLSCSTKNKILAGTEEKAGECEDQNDHLESSIFFWYSNGKRYEILVFLTTPSRCPYINIFQKLRRKNRDEHFSVSYVVLCPGEQTQAPISIFLFTENYLFIL